MSSGVKPLTASVVFIRDDLLQTRKCRYFTSLNHQGMDKRGLLMTQPPVPTKSEGMANLQAPKRKCDFFLMANKSVS